MNVASLELSKTLFELSGWDKTQLIYYPRQMPTNEDLASDPSKWNWQLTTYSDKLGVPAYDLGYLLRKLPYWTRIEKYRVDDVEHFSAELSVSSDVMPQHGDTPEDAAAKLCVELIKSGQLNPTINKE